MSGANADKVWDNLRVKESGQSNTVHRVPKLLGKLSLRCDGVGGRYHVESAPMAFVGPSLTNHGCTCADYRCCVPDRPVSERWIMNRETRRPERLFRARLRTGILWQTLRWCVSLAHLAHFGRK